MHSVWYGLGLVAASAFVLAGCATSEPNKIPKHPEEYNIPPSDDARYSQPPAFPKNTLNTDRTPIKSDGTPLGQGGRMSQPGRSAGAGGPGGGF